MLQQERYCPMGIYGPPIVITRRHQSGGGEHLTLAYFCQLPRFIGQRHRLIEIIAKGTSNKTRRKNDLAVIIGSSGITLRASGHQYLPRTSHSRTYTMSERMNHHLNSVHNFNIIPTSPRTRKQIIHPMQLTHAQSPISPMNGTDWVMV